MSASENSPRRQSEPWSIWEVTPFVVFGWGLLLGALVFFRVGDPMQIIAVVAPLALALLAPSLVLSGRVLNNRYFREKEYAEEVLWAVGGLAAVGIGSLNAVVLGGELGLTAGLASGGSIVLAFIATVVLSRASDRLPPRTS